MKKTNQFSHKIILSLLFVIPLLGNAQTESDKDAPNFIFILTDDQGWSQLSSTMDAKMEEAKSSYLETPRINSIGDAGMRFTDGYAPAPLCTPSRRSIQCGTVPARSGSEFPSIWVPDEHLTIPKALKRANPDYMCAHFGKWGENMISTPESCAYDVSDGLTGNSDGGMPVTLNPGHPNPTHENTPPDYINNHDPKNTFSLVEKTIGFMQQQVRANKPFFVQVSFYAQHLSVVTTEKSLQKYKKKGAPDRAYSTAWAAMLDDLDQGVGKLLDGLDALGVTDNTYVILMSDNGGRKAIPGGDINSLPPNYPLSGAKHSVYEGGIRVPFIISGPGIKANSTSHIPIVGYDLLPTLYELAGGNAQQLPSGIDGVSIKSLFKNPTVELKRFKNALVFHRPKKGYSAIRKDNFKLIVKWKNSTEISKVELYDLSSNPIEDGNELSDKYPEKVKQLKVELLSYLKSVKAEKPYNFF